MSSSKYLNCFLNSKNYTYILVVVFLVGITIRIVGISSLPSGLNQDEASIGYEAFSILNYGIDRNSMSFPIHLIAWGNGQNALYAYLSMPFISIFGLNTFSVRIVNSIFSILSLFVFFSIFKLIFDRKKALVALGLLAICPWSIMSSRWGLESNIFPTILLIAVFFLLKGVRSNSVYLFFSFFFFAISLYSYGTSYLIVPVLFAFILPYLIAQKYVSKIVIAISLGIFTVLALPIFLPEKQSKNSRINISPASVNMPYIYVCFYNQIDPELFNRTVSYDSVANNGFRKVVSFGKYTFSNDINSTTSIQILNKSELSQLNDNEQKYNCFGNFAVLLNK